MNTIGLLEYKASAKLELAAMELRESMGANAFYSLLAATFRQAGTMESLQLAMAFPGLRESLQERILAPGGLKPGETFTQDGARFTMDDKGKVIVEYLEKNEEE